MRIAALIIGLIGVVIAFVINFLYSFLHVLGRVTGITNDQTHFFWGLFVILIGFVGSLFALFIPTVGWCCWLPLSCWLRPFWPTDTAVSSASWSVRTSEAWSNRPSPVPEPD